MSNGTLVALADGGALLVGRTTRWFADPFGNTGFAIRSLRFDALTSQWAETDQSFFAGDSLTDQMVETGRGHSRHGALVARLPDGRVLVAGGERFTGYDTYVTVASADLYDPDADTWSSLPPMPEARAGGAAVVLADGSVLIVGGYNESPVSESGERPTGLASAVRFVASR
jgi:hypothetical protein